MEYDLHMINGPSTTIQTSTVTTGGAKSTWLKGLIGVLVSVGALSVVVFSVNWTQVTQAFMQMHYWPLLPAIILIAAQMVLRGMRWRHLLPDDKQITTRQLVDAVMVGNFASSILPLRAGEFIRPFLLTLQSRFSFPTTFVSVVIERFFDLSAVLISFGLVSYSISETPDWVVSGATALGVLATGLLVFIIIGALCPVLVKRVAFWACSFLPKKLRQSLERFISNLLEGAMVLQKPERLAKVILYTALIWLATYASYYVYFWLFDIQASFMQAVVVTVFIALAVAAPSAPGFIGVYQIGCIAAFALFSVNIDTATAYALVSHLIQYVVTVLYGAYALSRTEWSLSDLVKRRATVG